jgi:hypothetical protein
MAEKKGKEAKESKIKGNSLGASGFTLGILGIISLSLIGAIMSLIGLIFCFIQQKKKPTKLGKAGLIIGILGLVINSAYLIWYFLLGGYQYLQSLNTSLT